MVVCFLFPYLMGMIQPENFPSPSESRSEAVSIERMDADDKLIYISDRWLFKAGDNAEWASPSLDDRDWTVVSTFLSEVDVQLNEWSGIGWFRLELQVDSTLTGKPLALIVDNHLGASELYLNGDLIYKFGKITENPYQIEPYSNKNPKVIQFSETGRHQLAVRYANPDFDRHLDMFDISGFRFFLGDWAYHQELKFTFIEQWVSQYMFFIGVVLAIGIVHLLLFFYYPSEKRNLYFSLFTLFLAVFSYGIFKTEIVSVTNETILLIRAMFAAEVLVLLLATRFTHSMYRTETTLPMKAYMAVGTIIAIIVWIYPTKTEWLRSLFIIVSLLEVIRVMALLMIKNRSGALIIGVGILSFVLGISYNYAVNMDWVVGEAAAGSMMGSGILILSMSLFLSKEFSSTRKRLKSKLEEVQELSKKSLEQERISQKREIEKRLLEAENERKSRELEEARALQLSMLPKKLPDLPRYDIAVLMETATEVGGDYYDYSVGKDGELTVAVGDATGHGLKAGIMVAAAKSYFHTLVQETDSENLLARMSSGIRNLDMRMMYMGMMVMQCRESSFTLTTAGMPPALHYRKQNDSVQQIILKGLPLGTKVKYPYKSHSFTVCDGDCILLMSDGLMELFNDNREMLGMEKIEQILLDSAGYSSKDIVNSFRETIEKWAGAGKNDDDITLLVLKVNPI